VVTAVVAARQQAVEASRQVAAVAPRWAVEEAVATTFRRWAGRARRGGRDDGHA
jgi:hypothetical protein